MPMEEAYTSVIIAKTTMTIAEVVFILLGIALSVWLLGGNDSSGQTLAAALLSVGLLALGTATFVFVQRQGLCIWLLEFLRKIGLKIAYLEAREKNYSRWIGRSLNFIATNGRRFIPPLGCTFLAGWQKRWRCTSSSIISAVLPWLSQPSLSAPSQSLSKEARSSSPAASGPKTAGICSFSRLSVIPASPGSPLRCSGDSENWCGLGSGYCVLQC